MLAISNLIYSWSYVEMLTNLVIKPPFVLNFGMQFEIYNYYFGIYILM